MEIDKEVATTWFKEAIEKTTWSGVVTHHESNAERLQLMCNKVIEVLVLNANLNQKIANLNQKGSDLKSSPKTKLSTYEHWGVRTKHGLRPHAMYPSDREAFFKVMRKLETVEYNTVFEHIETVEFSSDEEAFAHHQAETEAYFRVAKLPNV